MRDDDANRDHWPQRRLLALAIGALAMGDVYWAYAQTHTSATLFIVDRAMMRTIGMLGGMSWESTALYYRLINEAVKAQLGGLHSAKILLHSLDFAAISELLHAGDWDAIGETLARSARSLEASGADFIVLCTNTMHKVASTIEGSVSIPLLHIVDPTGAAAATAGHQRLGLIGTRFTMQQAFYAARLREQHNQHVVVPGDADQEMIHRVIFDELCLGKVMPASRDAFRRVIDDLVARGAQAIVLGCTEIVMLLRAEDSEVPLYDTTSLHALAAARAAMDA